MTYKYKLPEPGSVKLTDLQKKYVDFISENHLKNPKTWETFVDAFRTDTDTEDGGWRGEYWGKMMRGAALVYRCTADKELYAILEKAVFSLLSAADDDGRISSYSREKEFTFWDMWCRKYVITGMLHFYDICTDEALKEKILTALKKHLDLIIKSVGPDEGQVDITKTSSNWLGVNSCSILEPVMDMFKRTGEKRYFDFAQYIIGTGGIEGGNLVELALENEKMPFEYPETKAYETMSFFEGVLACYEVTGESRLFEAVEKFVDAVYKTDITIIGCAGCTHELFDNSAVKQTEYSEVIMQETCVTVTWMRLCARLFLLTGNEKYADYIEQSALNALYGSVNLYSQPMKELWSGETVEGLPFDSYSPLFMNTRGRGVGGYKRYTDGRYYGCCACIGAAGIGLYPLIDNIRNKKNEEYELKEHYLNGKIAFTYGPFVLARDSAKENADISKPLNLNGTPGYTLCTPCGDECIRLALHTADGDILLTDYASCGKKWSEENPLITVWMEKNK